MQNVLAGTLTTAALTISDSRASNTGTTHSFTFTTATTGTIASVRFEYCTASTGTCSAPTGLTIGTAVGSVTGLGAGTGGVASNVATYTVTSPASVNNGVAITIPWTNVTNPSTADTSFFVNITTRDGSNATIDTAQVAAAVLTDTSITVTASIGPTFTFTVDPVDGSNDTSGIGLVNGQVNGATLDVVTTANTIPFGTLADEDPNTAAHDITVETNSVNGYQVTVKYIDPGSSAPLNDGSNNIDNFTGTNASPASWATGAPNGGVANTNTGFFGYTTEDFTLGTGTTNRFSSNNWAGFSTTPEELIYNAAAPAGGSESKRVGWRAEVNELQPAGNYTGTIILVATPTY
ncbi:hypothetical protein IPM65_03625 [Candidatus Roizmanbacteria bacterium]|nr:MAG: hypothetical protein IPM65_03625 [Candidatus Roizmanbacteria bacterium]